MITLDSELGKQIVQLFIKEKKSRSEVAEKLQIAVYTLANFLKRNGYETSKIIKKLSPEQEKFLIEFCPKFGLKYCSEKLSIPHFTLNRFAKQLNLRYIPKQTSTISKVIKNRENVKKRIKAQKIKAIEYKGGKCEICGYNKCIRSLCFHHKNPLEKNFLLEK
jgi:hypothetical protein